MHGAQRIRKGRGALWDRSKARKTRPDHLGVPPRAAFRPFGLVDGRSGASEEVGRQFMVTRERIRQIETKGLRNMGILADFRHLEGFLESRKLNDGSSPVVSGR